jgi:hypothetical protein
MSNLIGMNVWISLECKSKGVKRVVRLKMGCEFPSVPRIGDYFNCALGPFPVIKVDFNCFPEQDHLSIEFTIEDQGGTDYRGLETMSEELETWIENGWIIESDTTTTY